jgi:hypothetical protein
MKSARQTARVSRSGEWFCENTTSVPKQESSTDGRLPDDVAETIPSLLPGVASITRWVNSLNRENWPPRLPRGSFPATVHHDDSSIS